MKKQQKVKVLEGLKERLSKAKSLVLTDYRGLTHRQMEEIKKALKVVGADFMVTKNTLLKIATQKTGLPREFTEGEFLRGPTAILFSYQDEIAPFSTLAKFIKNFGLPQIKIGKIGEKVLSSEEILRLATLPSKEVLTAQLIRNLKFPISRTSYALSWNIRKLILVCSFFRSKTRG